MLTSPRSCSADLLRPSPFSLFQRASVTREPERQTRRERIDPKLRAARWTILPVEKHRLHPRPGIAVEELETANGPADYGLFEESRCLGVVEAKKLTLGPQEVLTQAQRYARGIDQKPRWQGEYG